MRALILAAGSRGDVAPYTGVGVRLRDAGHEAVLAAPEAFAGLVGAAGLPFHALPADPRGGPAGRAGSGTRELLRAAEVFLRDLGGGLADAVAAHRPDVLVLATTTAPLGWHIAEACGVPSVGAYLQPVAPTGAFPPVVGGARSLGRWGNRAAGRLALRVVDRVHADAVRGLRRRLGLPPRSGAAVRRGVEASGWPVLHGFSEVLVPRPGDWRAGLEVCGPWWPHVPDGAALPDAVEEFLRAGPAPVFVGFGSMGAGDGARLGELAVRALRMAGARGVVQAGAAGLAARDGGPGGEAVRERDVLWVGDVPHALLFPRTAAVVHHAGAGTSAAALRAGVPSVPVPFTADQPFWARRLAAVGAGTAPLPAARLTAESLAAAIRDALDDASYRRAASGAARLLAREDGAGALVRRVEAAAGG
ncbi:glycosyltransferase [Streptomyces sp. NPDC030392]|uniref:glycosyltransferase n=1 Tax=Streptomyces sp. NPDC030392 TaxID=3155468 RepID=UPI003406C008